MGRFRGNFWKRFLDTHRTRRFLDTHRDFWTPIERGDFRDFWIPIEWGDFEEIPEHPTNRLPNSLRFLDTHQMVTSARLPDATPRHPSNRPFQPTFFLESVADVEVTSCQRLRCTNYN